ncbi:MAG: helix-turn-helix domain-containing protein [Thermoleophilia bacterium]
MVDVEYIKKRQDDGWSIRTIARQLGYSRQTVRKVLTGPAEPLPAFERKPRAAGRRPSLNSPVSSSLSFQSCSAD